MAWPLSRYVDFFLGTVPEIAAAFLNSAQDKIIGVFSGGLTLLAVTVDGLGGQVATPTAGWVTASAGVAGAVLKAVQAMGSSAGATGVLYADLVPFAAAKIKADGTVLRGANVLSVTHGSAGQYTILLRSCPAAYAGLADNTAVDLPIVLSYQHNASVTDCPPTVISCRKVTSGVAVIQIVAQLGDSSTAGVDRNFTLVVWP